MIVFVCSIIFPKVTLLNIILGVLTGLLQFILIGIIGLLIANVSCYTTYTMI